MRRGSGRFTVGAVLLLLGFLVVVQLRSQAAVPGLSALSAQDLTALVANLTTRNNELRDEISALQRQHDTTQAAVQRGDTSSAQIRADLTRIEAWSGALAIVGSGVRIEIDGALPGDAIGQLINELRNAGAEGIAVGGVRVVPAVVVTGPGGDVTLDGAPVPQPLVILAVGQPEVLTGSLTRSSGPIAQLAALYPEVTISVAAADRVTLPATQRNLVPTLGHPRI